MKVTFPHLGYHGERVLVTGAKGFIGSHLCRRLCTLGAELHAVSRLENPFANSPIRWWKGDLADTAWVEYAIQKIQPSIIFHLASAVAGARQLDLVIPTFRSNLASTVNLLASAAETGCRRVVLAGSQEEPEPNQEGAIPCSPYAAAKWSASAYGRMFHALFQLPVVTLRIFMVYGPGQKDLRKLVPYVISSLLRGEAPRVSSGARLVDWIYVEDVVEALLAAGEREGISGRTLDVGSGQTTSVRNVVEMIASATQTNIAPLFGAIGDRPLEQTRVADVAKSQAALQWSPAVSLPEGLRRTLEWYRSQSDALREDLVPAPSASC